MFWTSLRERRCSTRRRRTAASSSVLVLSSIVMALSRRFCAIRSNLVGSDHPLGTILIIDGGLSHILPYRGANRATRGTVFRGSAEPNPSRPLTAVAGLSEIVNELI